MVYFVNFADQRVYRQSGLQDPEPLTAAGAFYADCHVDERRDRLLCVREEHPVEPGQAGKTGEPINTIAAISLTPGGLPDRSNDRVRVLASGADFYSTPR